MHHGGPVPEAAHAYTITHAIEDGNVLRFHIDYFKPEGKKPPKPGEAIAKKAVIEAILAKHDAATGGRRFNAILATASINDAIEYHALFKAMQEKKGRRPRLQAAEHRLRLFAARPAGRERRSQERHQPAVQRPAAEQEDNQVEPEKKKQALEAILADYNARYGTNHRLSEFDLYYQDVQKRIKDQQWPNSDYPAAQKIDITIVVDMLLTGFDSKFLNTLYVDKNLKHHGLIQAFSHEPRAERHQALRQHPDFRQQQDVVDAAIALFSPAKRAASRRGNLARGQGPVVIHKLETAVQKLDRFMQSQGLDCTPSAVANLKGDEARAAFITHFKEVQRLKTQLDQYTDLTQGKQSQHPAGAARGKPARLQRPVSGNREEAQGAAGQERRDNATEHPADQLDFEFVLFASAVIDYDYIMGLIVRLKGPGKSKMSREDSSA